MEPIKLVQLTRRPEQVFTRIQVEEPIVSPKTKILCEFSIEFGECRIHKGERSCSIKGFMPYEITDVEHDSALSVLIGLIGIEYKFTLGHTTFLDAYITTDPGKVRFYSKDFDPREIPDIATCTGCEEKHLVVPEDYYVPPKYEYAKALIGKRVNITYGPKEIDD